MNVTNEDGDIEDWLVEMSSLSTLIREGWTDESMSAGDEITIAILRSRTAYRGRLLFGMYKSSDEMIEMRHELGGAIRSILMDAVPPAADRPYTKLGYSSGHWENDVLAIETTHLSGGMIFTNRGYPISGEARITERYWREDGQNLQMELFVYDAVNYTEPLRFALEWIWSPDEQVLAWDCISLGPRDAEPDMDELRRLLNQQ